MTYSAASREHVSKMLVSALTRRVAIGAASGMVTSANTKAKTANTKRHPKG